MTLAKSKAKTYNPSKIWLLIEVTHLKDGLVYRYLISLKDLPHEVEQYPEKKWSIRILQVGETKFAIKKYFRSLKEHENKRST